MSIQIFNVTILLFIFSFYIIIKAEDKRQSGVFNAMQYSNKYQSDHSKSFFFYKSNSLMERSCDCKMETSCKCCESVVMPLIQSTKLLCANFTYQNNNLNIDILLDANVLRTMTVITYRPFTMCTSIPRSVFSFVCLNVLELNNFPKSITACPQLDIKTKAQIWKLNYICMSISKTMPITSNETMIIPPMISDVTINIPPMMNPPN